MSNTTGSENSHTSIPLPEQCDAYYILDMPLQCLFRKDHEGKHCYYYNDGVVTIHIEWSNDYYKYGEKR